MWVLVSVGQPALHRGLCGAPCGLNRAMGRVRDPGPMPHNSTPKLGDKKAERHISSDVKKGHCSCSQQHSLPPLTSGGRAWASLRFRRRLRKRCVFQHGFAVVGCNKFPSRCMVAHSKVLKAYMSCHPLRNTQNTETCTMTRGSPGTTTHDLLPTTQYPIPTTHYSLPGTHYSLLTTRYSLSPVLSTHFTSRDSLLTTRYSLLTTHYFLLATYYTTRTTHHSRLTARYSRLTTHYSLPTTRDPLLTTHCLLPTTHHSLLILHYPLPLLATHDPPLTMLYCSPATPGYTDCPLTTTPSLATTHSSISTRDPPPATRHSPLRGRC